MRTYIINFIFIISLVYTNNICTGQNLDNVFRSSKDYLIAGDTSQARTVLLKLICFDSSHVYTSHAYQLLGNIEAQKGDFAKAHVYYDYSYSFEKDKNVRNEILVKKILLFLNKEEFSLASSSAEMLDISESDSCLYRLKILTQVLRKIISNELLSAKNTFLILSKSKTDSLYIESIFNNRHSKIEFKSLKKAKFLSAILPGAGQLYLGDSKNGLNSFFLVGAWTYLVVYTAIVYNPLSSFLIVFPWWFRYYNGGIKKDEVIFYRKKKENQNEIYLQLIQYYNQKGYFCYRYF